MGGEAEEIGRSQREKSENAKSQSNEGLAHCIWRQPRVLGARSRRRAAHTDFLPSVILTDHMHDYAAVEGAVAGIRRLPALCKHTRNPLPFNPPYDKPAFTISW
jgi:hypothetical protein